MTAETEKKAAIIIISGPSGVGKSTICRQVVKRMDDVYLSVSVTTRPQSEGEIDGRDYWFISKEDFDKRARTGMLLEYAEVFGNNYGTPRDKVQEAVASGKTVILEIDVQGARQAKEVYPDAAMVFILPPTHKDLVQRMNDRGREDNQNAEHRLNGAGDEIAAAWQYYQHMVINDDLEQAVNEIMDIIKDLRSS
jgi:guanylate kinase